MKSKSVPGVTIHNALTDKVTLVHYVNDIINYKELPLVKY